MTTDPKDAGIARLKSALAESEAAAEGALMILVQTQAERDATVERAAAREAWAAECLLENECLTAERDAALAQVARAHETAAETP